MDIPTGMMMTAVALFQEAETPLGHTGVLDPPQSAETGEETGQVQQDPMAEDRQRIVDAVAQQWQDFERQVAARGIKKDVLYRQLRALARKFGR
jgi:hypothetical protein